MRRELARERVSDSSRDQRSTKQAEAEIVQNVVRRIEVVSLVNAKLTKKFDGGRSELSPGRGNWIFAWARSFQV